MRKPCSRAYNRDVSRRKALRKRRITEEVYSCTKDAPYYDNLHQYSKNKVHCSCWMCSSKTRNKGKRRHLYGNHYPSYNYSISDCRKIESLDYSKREAFFF